MNKEEILSGLESLKRKIENGDIEAYSYQIGALNEVIKEYHIDKSPLASYFNLENWLYQKDEKDINIKSAILWGGLWVIRQMQCITWEDMQKLYGEFMSKQMNLR